MVGSVLSRSAVPSQTTLVSLGDRWLMDHVPYPVSTSVPPIDVLLLYHDDDSKPVGTAGSACTLTNHDDLHHDFAQFSSFDTHPGTAPSSNRNVDTPKNEERHELGEDWTSSFWRYPERRGWCSAGSRSWWTTCSSETARRAQEWMYFELLSRFLGERINTKMLSRQSSDGKARLLDSSALPQLLTRWMTKHSESRQTGNQVGSGTSAKAASVVPLSLLDQVVFECTYLDNLPEPSKSTSLAISILVNTLATAIHTLAGQGLTERSTLWTLDRSFLLEKRFLENSWCAYQVAQLWGRYSSSTMYYLSSLPRQRTFGGMEHGRCSKSQCAVTSIDPATYEHQHVEACSADGDPCRMAGVRSSDVAACIRGGRIPLIKFEESIDGALRPCLVESDKTSRYVAISHVWSGGLGNVKSNAMFTCQLRKIQALLQTLRDDAADDLDRDLGIRKTQGLKRVIKESVGLKPAPEPPLMLWIDTLCVPVGHEEEDARQRAIAQMAQIYVEAQCVLVLDPELQTIDHKGLPDQDIFAYTLCSSWNSRSWTFQEACVARVFYLQFSDGYCAIDNKWHKFFRAFDERVAIDASALEYGERRFDMGDFLLLEVSNWFRTMPVMTKVRGYDARTLMSKSEDWENIVRVWNGLRTRSTTKTDDLYGIIAIMVDLSAYEILQLKPEERMKAILRSQSTLPMSLLYQTCDKLRDTDGKLTWAPSNIAGRQLDMDSGYMKMQDDGMLIQIDGTDPVDQAWPYIYRISTKGAFPPSLNMSLGKYNATVTVELSLSNQSPDANASETWILLAKEVPHQARIVTHSPGALLVVDCLEGAFFVTRYCCPVSISFTTHSDPVAEKEKVEQSQGSLVQRPDVQSIALREHPIKILSGTNKH
ncbi:MAG: hypothetical protein Q9222_005530 [Ikaeria aurantiellina]